MNGSLMWWMAPADSDYEKEGIFNSHLFSRRLHLTAGAAGQPIHGNFTSCKDKKEEGGRREDEGKGGGREEEGWRSAAGRHYQYQLASLEKKQTRKKKKKHENKRQPSDILRCYLLKRRTPPSSPVISLSLLPLLAHYWLFLAWRPNCAGFSRLNDVH